eukprot:9838611-Alexandrium_andersonii.AAC.1
MPQCTDDPTSHRFPARAFGPTRNAMHWLSRRKHTNRRRGQARIRPQHPSDLREGVQQWEIAELTAAGHAPQHVRRR